MKKLILLAIMLTSYLGFSQLEPKTAVVNGTVINGKTTANIQALAVAPNGYIQYSTDTETLWLKTASGWVDTGTAGTDDQTLAEVLASGNSGSNLGITSSGSIIPDVGIYYLGSSTNPFRTGYFNTLSLSGNNVYVTGANNIFTNGANEISITKDDGTTNDFNININGLTEQGNLVATDSDITYQGTSLLSGSDVGQVLSPTTKSTGLIETYDNSDVTNGGTATAERKWNKHTTNDTILLSSAITRYNQPWLESLSGADSLYIKKDVGTTLYIADSVAAISADGIIMKGGRKAGTLIAESSNVFSFFGEATVFNEVVIAPNEYNGLNAADTDEVNGTATTELGSNTALVSSTAQFYDGAYSLLASKTSGIGTSIYLQTQGIATSDAVNGSLWVFRPTGSASDLLVRFQTAEGWGSEVTVTITSAQVNEWVEVPFSNTAGSANPKIRLNDTSSSIGNTYYVDKVYYTTN
tara:strand:- start:3857 stop:5260 length:1404 start_codon:yes stop_codon:yes gene_type:complete